MTGPDDLLGALQNYEVAESRFVDGFANLADVLDAAEGLARAVRVHLNDDDPADEPMTREDWETGRAEDHLAAAKEGWDDWEMRRGSDHN